MVSSNSSEVGNGKGHLQNEDLAGMPTPSNNLLSRFLPKLVISFIY